MHGTTFKLYVIDLTSIYILSHNLDRVEFYVVIPLKPDTSPHSSEEYLTEQVIKVNLKFFRYEQSECATNCYHKSVLNHQTYYLLWIGSSPKFFWQTPWLLAYRTMCNPSYWHWGVGTRKIYRTYHFIFRSLRLLQSSFSYPWFHQLSILRINRSRSR